MVNRGNSLEPFLKEVKVLLLYSTKTVVRHLKAQRLTTCTPRGVSFRRNIDGCFKRKICPACVDIGPSLPIEIALPQTSRSHALTTYACVKARECGQGNNLHVSPGLINLKYFHRINQGK